MNEKPALFIYRDGRVKPTNRVFPYPTVKEWECWPTYSWRQGFTDYEEPPREFPLLERAFRFIGEAGPYNVYAEI